MRWPPGELEVARHEAAHAAAGLLGGFRVIAASIAPEPGRAGCVALDLSKRQEEQWAAGLQDEIKVRWAVAVAIGYAVAPRPGAGDSSDFTAVEWVAGRLSPGWQEGFWQALRVRVENLLASDDFRALHAELTEALLRVERLSGDQISAIALNVLGRPAPAYS